MKMKKILIYGLSNMYGGVEAFILNYVNHLPENKYTVELIIMNRTPQYLGEKLTRSKNSLCSRKNKKSFGI